MRYLPERTVLLEIGNFVIRWYAVLILTGAILVYYLVLNIAGLKRR